MVFPPYRRHIASACTITIVCLGAAQRSNFAPEGANIGATLTIAISLPLRLCLALALGLPMAGCAIFPAGGPTRKDIVEDVTPSLTSDAPSYAIVEIDQNSLLALARRAPPTLRGYFGDYRPAGSQTIGIGDLVQITVWEAASGGLFSASGRSDEPGFPIGGDFGIRSSDGTVRSPFLTPDASRSPAAASMRSRRRSSNDYAARRSSRRLSSTSPAISPTPLR